MEDPRRTCRGPADDTRTMDGMSGGVAVRLRTHYSFTDTRATHGLLWENETAAERFVY